MIIRPGKSKIVYIGKKDDKIKYIGRGALTRAIALIEGNHHIISEFDEVEVLGPMTHEESIELEKKMILEHCPPLNNLYNREKHPVTGYIPTGMPRGRAKGSISEKTQMIIDELKTGEMKNSDIARKYGVSRQQVTNIKGSHINI